MDQTNSTGFEPLTVDTSFEYALDSKLFPGWEDPVLRLQPSLLINEGADCIHCQSIYHENIQDVILDMVENADVLYNSNSTSPTSGYISDEDFDDLLSIFGDIEPRYSSPCSQESNQGVFGQSLSLSHISFEDIFEQSLISPLSPMQESRKDNSVSSPASSCLGKRRRRPSEYEGSEQPVAKRRNVRRSLFLDNLVADEKHSWTEEYSLEFGDSRFC